MPWSVSDHAQAVAEQHRAFLRTPWAFAIDPLEAFDAASECQHGNVPGAPGGCDCFLAPKVTRYPPPLAPLKPKPKPKPRQARMTIPAIAKFAECDRNWVTQRIGRFSHLVEAGLNAGGFYSPHYPASVARILRRERRQFMAHPLSGSYLHTDQIAREVGKSYLWVAKTLFRLGYNGEIRRIPDGRAVKHFPPCVVPVLKRLAAEYPPSASWLSLPQIVEALGAEREWVERRIIILKIQGEMRVRPGYGKAVMHYPPQAVDLIRTIQTTYPEAGDWYSANSLRLELDRSANWIRRRLEEMKPASETRLDSQRVPRTHYPPTFLISLRRHKAVEDELGGRIGKGLPLRLSIVSLLSDAGPIAVPQIQLQLAGGPSQKLTYDALNWLRRKNFARVVDSSQKPNQWHLTPHGKHLAEKYKLTS